MDNDFIILTKYDVAERQLNQAIRLFFAEEDPVSIRTLVEAAAEIIAKIGPYKGVIRDKEIVVPMTPKEWIKKAFESRNFFKHADRDKDETLDFNPLSNDFVLLDAVMMFNQLKGSWTAETKLFYVWCLQTHPDLWDDESPDKIHFKSLILEYPLDKGCYQDYISEVKCGKRTI